MDPFGMDTKSLVGHYSMYFFDESHRFYVFKRGGEPICGAFDGEVHQVGWDADYILANVTRCNPHYTNGWYLLSVKTGLVDGPLSQDQIYSDPRTKSLQAVTAEQAFKTL